MPCPRCGARIRSATADPIAIDVLGDVPEGRSLGARAMDSRWLARVYDRLWRPLAFSLSTGFGAPSREVEARVVIARFGGRCGPWLDLSCGSGWLTRRLTHAAQLEGTGRQVFGVDSSRAMLERARSSAPAAVLVRADAAALPFEDGVFAGVANLAALDLYPSPARVVFEVARVLAPGGRWVASSFVGAGSTARSGLRAVSGTRPPTVAEIEGWARDAGLSGFRTRPFRGYVIAWADKP
jgi:SAM-dependent methyltransferase